MRGTAWFTAIAAIAAVAASGAAMYSVFSRDLVQESIKLAAVNGELQNQHNTLQAQQSALQSERLRMVAENGLLEETKQRLSADQGVIAGELDSARREQASLTARAIELRGELVRQARQLHQKASELTQMATTRDNLRAQTDALSDKLGATSDTLLRAALMAHLASYKPSFLELAQDPVYNFLIRGNASASASENVVAWSFVAMPESELSAEDIRGSCVVQSGVRAFGLRVDVTGTETSGASLNTSFKLLDAKNPMLARICKFLGARMIGMRMPDRKPIRVTVFDFLRKAGKDSVNVNLLPGAAGAMPYEQWRVRSFWSPALGNLYRGKYLKRLDSENGGSLRRVMQGEILDQMPSNIKMGQTLAEMVSELSSDSNVAPVRERFQALDRKWVPFLKGYSVEVGYRTQRLMDGDKFREFLPRFTFAEIGTWEFLEARDLVREFDYSVFCAAEEFASGEDYLDSLDDEARACKLRQQAIAAGRAAAERIDIPK